MTRYILGYLGEWQEKFDDKSAAIERAEEVAESGFTVEVVRRRFGLHSFVTGFPESERKALRARWRAIPIGSGDGGGGGAGNGHAHHHYNSIGSHGGGAGGGGHGGGHGGH